MRPNIIATLRCSVPRGRPRLHTGHPRADHERRGRQPGFVCCDSQEFLPKLVESGNRFDMVLIDGNHDYEPAKADYLASREIVRPKGIILYDDANIPDLARLLDEIRSETRVEQLLRDLMLISPPAA